MTDSEQPPDKLDEVGKRVLLLINLLMDKYDLDPPSTSDFFKLTDVQKVDVFGKCMAACSLSFLSYIPTEEERGK